MPLDLGDDARGAEIRGVWVARERGESITAAVGDTTAGLEGLMGGVMIFLMMSLVLIAFMAAAAAARTGGGGEVLRWRGVGGRATGRCL